MRISFKVTIYRISSTNDLSLMMGTIILKSKIWALCTRRYKHCNQEHKENEKRKRKMSLIEKVRYFL